MQVGLCCIWLGQQLPTMLCSAPHPSPFAVLLGEAELGGHNPERAAAWLAAAPPLFPRLGLLLATHFSRLMPLLLGWCCAPQQHVRLAALAALLGVIQLTWPRIQVHAAVLWGVLRKVHGEETQCRCGLAGLDGAGWCAGSGGRGVWGGLMTANDKACRPAPGMRLQRAECADP